MIDTLKAVAVGILSFMVLDGLWLGVLMNAFYREQLAPIARLSPSGGLAPNWTAALLVYVLLGTGIALLAVPRADNALGAAAWGALLGLVVYGVYDLTNLATLKQWPLAVVLADIGWGIVASATCALVVRLVSRT